MKRLRSSFLAIPIVTLLSFVSGDCKKNESNPVEPSLTISGALTTGAAVDAGSQPIGPGGGTFTIAKPGSPLDGMQLNVPRGAYTDMRTFQVSYAPIQGHQLGQYFNPLTPLITISNGGGYADSVMKVRIPVKVPAGHFAMAFYYDPATGELEGLPTVAQDSTSLTLATRHFASSTLSATPGLARLLSPSDGVGSSSIVISSVLANVLLAAYGSGFEPGVDDWEFENLGSYITSPGDCGGMSCTAIWYYMEKKSKGSPKLWGRFDNDGNAPATPKIWEDDVLGHKFCSMVQSDKVWMNLFNFAATVGQFLVPRDAATYLMFAYSILETKKPAVVGLLGETAHAMVCYGALPGALLIADPNYPGKKDRIIDYQEPRFASYFSGPKATDLGHEYKNIYYGGNSALVNFNTIEQRWKQVADRTIGNDAFPAFTVKIIDDNDKLVPLEDGYSQRKTSLTVKVEAPSFNPGTLLVDENQNILTSSPATFSPGKHRLGVGVFDDNSNWVGFRWTNIQITGDTSIVPLAVGNTWNFKGTYYDKSGNVIITHTSESKVIGTTQITGETWYQLQESIDGGTPEVSVVTERPNGLWAVPASGPPQLNFQYPANPGDAYTIGSLASVHVDSVKVTRAVPAGTFTNCVQYTLQYGSGLPYYIETFSPGVGEIEKREYDQIQGGGSYLFALTQLTSYVLK